MTEWEDAFLTIWAHAVYLFVSCTKGGRAVKKGIHPEYVEAIVTCACGETWRTRSTKREIHLEVCSACHPFFTGKQKYVDSAGRVERFQRKYGQRSAGENKG
ncbi:50S ribosomal protein L31 [bacterium HR10]|nr:50S ribosomal protein L31 [bacterium HR10]